MKKALIGITLILSSTSAFATPQMWCHMASSMAGKPLANVQSTIPLDNVQTNCTGVNLAPLYVPGTAIQAFPTYNPGCPASPVPALAALNLNDSRGNLIISSYSVQQLTTGLIASFDWNGHKMKVQYACVLGGI